MQNARAVLSKSWPDGCDIFWQEQCSGNVTASLGWYSGSRSRYLPLLQSEHLVQCEACRRTVVAENFASHQELCRSLPLKELLADDPGSGTGRARSRLSNWGEEGGGSGRSGSRGPGGGAASAEPAFSLNMDQICGVRRGHKGGICDRPLGCRYHTLAQKRLVPGRSMAFEQLHAYSNRKRPSHAPGAEQPAVVAGLGGVAEEGLQDGTSYGGRVDEPVVRDPNWDAEWRRLLEAMPTYEEAAAASLCDAGARSGRWPTPLCDHQPVRKARRLWGVPLSSVKSTAAGGTADASPGGNQTLSPVNVKRLASASSPDLDLVGGSPLGLGALAPQPMC